MIGEDCVPDIIGHPVLFPEHGYFVFLVVAETHPATEPNDAVRVHMNAIDLGIPCWRLSRIQLHGRPGVDVYCPKPAEGAGVETAVSAGCETGIARESHPLGQTHGFEVLAVEAREAVASPGPQGPVRGLVKREYPVRGQPIG